MAIEWTEVPLGDVVEFLSGGTPSKSVDSYWGGEVPWVSAKDMKRFRLEDTEDHVTEEGARSGTRVIEPGTTLMLARGMTLHNDVPICVVMRPMAFNQDVKAVRPRDAVVAEFVPYLLLGHKQRLLDRVDSAGHGTGRLNAEALSTLQVGVPEPEEQAGIASVLGALDDKIELNRRMSETLEAIARALFRAWFVDVDPARAKADGSGSRPGTVAELVRSSRETVDPRTRPDEMFDLFSIPAFDAGRRPEPRFGSEIKSLKLLVPEGCILVSKLNPRIPRVWWPTVRPGRSAICSTEYVVLAPTEGVSLEYVYALTSDPAFSRDLEAAVTGTSGSHQRVTVETIVDMGAAIPYPEAMEKFTQIAHPLYARSRLAREEGQMLASLRDALLPKLISGELRVAVAEHR